ncbi:MAG: hypothetical protein AAF840_00190 [Bacteroidota bacterium]
MATKKTSANELLRRYVSGAITAPEEAALERLARQDEALAEAMRGLQSAPDEDHAARVRRMVQQARQENQPQGAKVVRSRPRRIRWMAAAAVLLLVASTMFFLPRLVESGESAMAMDEQTVPTAAEQDAVAAPVPEATAGAQSPTTTKEAEAIPPPPAARPPTKPSPKPQASSSPVAATTPEEFSDAASTEGVPAPNVIEPAGSSTEAEGELLEEVAAYDQTISPAPPLPRVMPTPTVTWEADDVLRDSLQQKARKRAPVVAKHSQPGTENLPAKGATLSGHITTENGYPIKNALVRFPGLPLGERTDTNGLFQLPVDATASSLIITHPDFETENVSISALSENVQISLERKPFQKDEQRPQWIQDGSLSRIIFDRKPGYASPLEGYNALRKRIEANRPEEVPLGKVKLSFLVNLDGTLSDFQFRGRPSQATMDYIGETIVKTSVWEVQQGDEPVRVYFKVVFEE